MLKRKSEKVWTVLEPDAKIVDAVSRNFRLPPPIAQAVVNRGHSSTEEVRQYLEPKLSELSDPFLLPNMERAVERVWGALLGEETILIYGDYDVDGITSTTLLCQVLKELGGDVCTFIPHRIDDGYGLSVESLEGCIEKHHPSLIITVDCGTGSVAAVDRAKEYNVDVIVTDHHEATEGLADVYALVNPKVGDNESLKMLAGVGVAFKLCHALIKRGREEGEAICEKVDLRNVLYLVALGTVADMVPLIEENRILAKCGINAMNTGHNVGLEALKKVSSITTDISSYHIGFLLGPRINAAGRLDNPRAALNLLMADQISEANILAKRLDEVNGERQLVEAEIVEDALERVSKAFNPDTDYCIVVGEEGWHPGVVGIVASRLVQRFQRPCVVIGFNKEGIGKGSCRSIGPFDLVEHLQKTSDHLIKYGGHQMAAGLEMSRDNFDAFREAFSKVARETLEGQDLRPVLKVDGWIEWVDVTNDLMAWSQRMEPFGLSNARPIWAVAGIEIVGTPQVVGKKHLKFSVAMGNKCLDVIAFGMGDREIPDGPIDLAFQVNNNNFRGVDSMQLQVQDFRLSVKEPN